MEIPGKMSVIAPPRRKHAKNFKCLFCFLCVVAVTTSVWTWYNGEYAVADIRNRPSHRIIKVKQVKQGLSSSFSRQNITMPLMKSANITVKNSSQTPVLISKPLTKKPKEILPCPKLSDIPSLIKKRTMNLSEELQISNAEKIILGTELSSIQQAVNGSKSLIHHKARFNSTGKNFMESLSAYGKTVGKYRWFPGGIWQPANCKARWKVAILIPYRNRAHHVPIVLRYLIPLLQKQLLSFAFFIINQGNSLLFNRAMLLNVGYLESLKYDEWDCFILHDVDHVPLSEINNYGCENMPRRLISGADRWNYRLEYPSFFGAVTGLTKENIQQINGFPNVYWGWGGEDDDILKRLKIADIKVHYAKGKIGYYNVIKHHHESAPKQPERHKLLRDAGLRLKNDGLKNLEYKLQSIELHALYTNISVDIWKL
ncbi:beta-1,4-galactosyltransferase 6-like [Asterias amurensis]|uniref:beta-1,4-galactosyltransferase 6-like n=1 Tax=Asterias amurensis TaxID=7602 RepID=UPI003AB24C3F